MTAIFGCVQKKGQVTPEVTVLSVFETPNGIGAHLTWNGAPGIQFELEAARDGRLLSWTAKVSSGGSVTARLLRSAPIGAMERAVRREVGASVVRRSESIEAGQWEIADYDLMRFRPETPGEIAEHLEEHRRWSQWRADFAERPRTGPAGRSDASYAALADAYIKELDKGEKNPVRTLADSLHLGEKTIRNYLFKARERGLLTSLGQGKAGGELTDKAKEILDGQH